MTDDHPVSGRRAAQKLSDWPLTFLSCTAASISPQLGGTLLQLLPESQPSGLQQLLASCTAVSVTAHRHCN